MGDGFCIAIVFGALMGCLLGMVIGSSFDGSEFKRQAVERGYALYCPADGALEWVGECGK